MMTGFAIGACRRPIKMSPVCQILWLCSQIQTGTSGISYIGTQPMFLSQAAACIILYIMIELNATYPLTVTKPVILKIKWRRILNNKWRSRPRLCLLA
jgi:hypothetical protein